MQVFPILISFYRRKEDSSKEGDKKRDIGCSPYRRGHQEIGSRVSILEESFSFLPLISVFESICGDIVDILNFNSLYELNPPKKKPRSVKSCICRLRVIFLENSAFE